MTTKLTLTIEETVISSAKKYAQMKGKSLSNLVENYLRSVSTGEKDSAALSPNVKKLMGTINLPENFDYKVAIADSIIRKNSK